MASITSKIISHGLTMASSGLWEYIQYRDALQQTSNALGGIDDHLVSIKQISKR